MVHLIIVLFLSIKFYVMPSKSKRLFLVIAHNHPYGQALPSETDLQLTEEIFQACQLVEIQLIDHIIITIDKNYSFAEHQQIKAVHLTTKSY